MNTALCCVFFLPQWRKREIDSVGSVTREGQFFYSAPHISSFRGFIEDHLVRWIMGRSTADSFDFFFTFTQTNQPMNLQSLASARSLKNCSKNCTKNLFYLFVYFFVSQHIWWDRKAGDHLPRKLLRH